MPYLLIRHRVENYETWKPVFDNHDATRGENGGKGGYLFRTAEDPNEIVLLLECEDLKKARRFALSEDLREAMQRAGVADRPDIYFLEELEKVPV